MYLRGQAITILKVGQTGYAMAALLVAIAVMSLMLSVAMPAWRHQMTREREAELVFRGEQYVRAIELFQRKYPGTYPPTIDVLVTQRFLRKKYKDPMVEDGEFQILYGVRAQNQPGVGGPAGAVSAPGAGGSAGLAAEALGSALRSQAGSRLGAQIGGPQGGGVSGVVSKSKEKSIRLYKGRNHYNEWQFIFVAAARPGGPGGVSQPGVGPGGGVPRPGQPRPGGPGGLGPGGPRGPRGGERPFGQPPPPPPPPRPGVIPRPPQ